MQALLGRVRRAGSQQHSRQGSQRQLAVPAAYGSQHAQKRGGQNLNVNSIVAFEFTARSGLIIGYNYQRGAPVLASDLGNEFFAKISYFFHF